MRYIYIYQSEVSVEKPLNIEKKYLKSKHKNNIIEHVEYVI